MDTGQNLTLSSRLADEGTNANIIRKSRVNSDALSVTAVIVYPIEDFDGDWVEPTGGDWTPHLADPFVNIEHDPTVRVGWLRKSLSQTGAPHTVRVETLDGTKVLVATTYFDKSSRASMQALRMIDDDILPGTSLEFGPVAGGYKVRHNKSFLKDRAAYTFSKWRGLGLAHCAQGVNPGALTITKSLQQVPERLTKILADKKLGTEELDPVFFKALIKYTPALGKSATVFVEKSMDSPLMPAATVGGDTLYDDEFGSNDDMEPRPRGGVAALYAKAQGLLNVCEQFEKDLESSDNPDLINKGKKICEKVRMMAEEAKGLGDKYDAKLTGMAEGKEAEAEEDSEIAREEGDEAMEDEEDAEDDEIDMEREEDDDKDGMFKAMALPHPFKVFKSIRPVYKKILKSMFLKHHGVKRFDAADLKKAQQEREAADVARLEKARRTLRKLG